MNMSQQEERSSEVPSRACLRRARRVCVKAGTSVVANESGKPSLSRLGAITEQIAELCNAGVEVIFVSSGSVGMGKRLLRKQRKMLMSFKDTMQLGDSNNPGEANLLVGDLVGSAEKKNNSRNTSFVNLLDVEQRPHTLAQKQKFYDSACAAAGQFEMMNLYSNLFAQCDVAASQILVTQADFVDPVRRNNLHYALERLLGYVQRTVWFFLPLLEVSVEDREVFC